MTKLTPVADPPPHWIPLYSSLLLHPPPPKSQMTATIVQLKLEDKNSLTRGFHTPL